LGVVVRLDQRLDLELVLLARFEGRRGERPRAGRALHLGAVHLHDGVLEPALRRGDRDRGRLLLLPARRPDEDGDGQPDAQRSHPVVPPSATVRPNTPHPFIGTGPPGSRCRPLNESVGRSAWRAAGFTPTVLVLRAKTAGFTPAARQVVTAACRARRPS